MSTSSDSALARLKDAESTGKISSSAAASIAKWLSEDPFEKYRGRLLEDIGADRWKQLDEAFYTVLEFGTGGRRGKMYPVGTNVLNDRTIAESARGLADYVISQKGSHSPRSCVIAHDTRHHSAEFAALCAGPGGSRIQGLSCHGAALHSPPLLRRSPPRLRCGHHDHCVTQPPLG